MYAIRSYYEDGVVTDRVAIEALALFGVDEYGLDELDREILTAIIENYSGGPVGIETISLMLGEDRRTLEEVV